MEGGSKKRKSGGRSEKKIIRGRRGIRGIEGGLIIRGRGVESRGILGRSTVKLGRSSTIPFTFH
jgi:hypothetical protein